ncbi:MAG TPA: DEAD/DEAH box helicase [Phycisphaerales bacterium]|nr:DEAD/DEAH box helicase [Phycisphaerales bacterium]
MDEVFDQNVTFKSLGLSEAVLRGLEDKGYERPTVAQSLLIPTALEGKDVLGQSKTGTGKTAAFGIPMLNQLRHGDGFGGLILVPTRELAIQVTTELRDLAHHTGLNVTAVYGGQKMTTQSEKLKRHPEIIVGTPGRVMDFHDRGQLPYERVKIAVLDEVDRMLDIGFRDDIRRILGTMRQKHQTVFVSATISDEIEKLARQYMHEPVRLNVTRGQSLTVAQVKQSHFLVEGWDKKRLLLHLLTHEQPALTLVFCRMKQTVDQVAKYLRENNMDVHAMHGDMYQGKRNRVMQQFREGDLSVLIASDLAARGLDVTGISHVINYDLPEDPDIYVHRIGRTARAGKDGIAWSFVTPEQGGLLTSIEQLTNTEVPKQEYPDFVPGPVPEEVVRRREMDAKRRQMLKEESNRSTVAPPTNVDAMDLTKFPGGLVPTALPTRRMGGRLRGRR